MASGAPSFASSSSRLAAPARAPSASNSWTGNATASRSRTSSCARNGASDLGFRSQQEWKDIPGPDCVNGGELRLRIVPTGASELLANELAESVSNLAVPGDRCLAAVGRVPINVVPLAVPMEHATGLLQLANEISAPHTSNSTSCRSAAGGAAERS